VIAEGTPGELTGVLDIAQANSTVGEGAAHRQILVGPGGRRIDGDYRITAFNPPRRLEFLVTAGPANRCLRTDRRHRPGHRRPLRARPPARGFMKRMTPMIARQCAARSRSSKP
jgi:hypothetical protein